MIFKMLFDHLNMLYLTWDIFRICGMDSRLIPRCFFSLASRRLEIFDFGNAFFEFWPLFSNLNVQQISWKHTWSLCWYWTIFSQNPGFLHWDLDWILSKQFYQLAKKPFFSKFWAPKFCPILTIFLLNNKYTSIHVHIYFCNSTLRISSGF